MTSASSAAPQPFITGVNYWPGRAAMRMWERGCFSIDSIAADFALIRGTLGMSLVRIFVTPHFMPRSHSEVDPECLGRLVAVAQLASRLGLTLDISSLAHLHMSGPNFLAPWMLVQDAAASEGSNPYGLQVVVPIACFGADAAADAFVATLPADAVMKRTPNYLTLSPNVARYRNPFHCPTMLAAQCLLLETLVATLHAAPGVDPSLIVFNLCNEHDQYALPRSPAEGVAWAEALCRVVKEKGPSFRVTCGLHTDSIRFPSNNLPVAGVFQHCNYMPVQHAYPQYSGVLCPDNKLDTEYCAFACVMTSVLIGRHRVLSSGSKVGDFDLAVAEQSVATLMEEWGGCTAHPGAPSATWSWRTKALGGQETERRQFLASEADLCGYVARTLDTLHRAGATGAVLWAFADYDPAATWQDPPCDENYHERFFGLCRADGSLKPHAEVIAAFRRTVRPHAEVVPLLRNVSKMMSEMDAELAEEQARNGGGAAVAAADNGTTNDWIRRHARGTPSCEHALAKVFKRFKELI